MSRPLPPPAQSSLRGRPGALSPDSPGSLGGLAALPRLGGKPVLTADVGAAAASHAAQQSKLKAQLRAADELRAAALAPPAQRTREQVEALCGFLASAHLLRHLQPTNIKTLAQTMTGSAWRDGEAIYRQGDAAKQLYVVLLGEVVMFEREQQQQQQQAAAWGDESSSGGSGSSGAAAAAAASSSGGSRHGGSSSSGGGTRQGGGAAGKLHKQPTLAAAGWPLAGSSATDGHVEVRRVGPREMLGADEAAGTSRLQTAVAGCATSTTFLLPVTAAAASVAAAAGAGAAAASSGGSSAREAHRRSGGGPVAPVAASSGATVVLQLSADDYGAALEGRLSAMLEEKVSFLAELPALKGLSSAYLRSLSHCFHQVEFEPREVLVRQGDVSDCMYVLESGQVCVLIDPDLTLTLAEAGSHGTAAAPSPPPPADGSSAAGELDLRKLVQVCLLGAGSIIGDMSVLGSDQGPPRRAATVVALTDLLTFKVPLREFKRRMPADVLEAMRRVANQKLVMNEQQATSRSAAAAAGLAGHVLLGGTVVSGAVLRGRGLRALNEAAAQAGGGDGSGLVDALQQYLAVSGGGSRDGGGGSTEQLLALTGDWRSAHSAAASPPPGDRTLPLEYAFPLPIPARAGSPVQRNMRGAGGLPRSGPAADGQQQQQQLQLQPPQRPASRSKPLRDSLDQLVLPQQQVAAAPTSQPATRQAADSCSSSVCAAAAARVAAAARQASQQLDAPGCCQQQLSPAAGGGFRGRLARPAYSPRQQEHEQRHAQQVLCVGAGGSSAVAKRSGGGRAAAASPGRLRSAPSSPEPMLLREAAVAVAAAGLLGGARGGAGGGGGAETGDDAGGAAGS